MIQEVHVGICVGPDTRGEDLLAEIKHLGIRSITAVRTARVYRLEGLDVAETVRLTETLLAEEVTQVYTLNTPLITDAARVIEVAYLPGVMNPEVASILKAAHDLGFNKLIAADSSTEYGFYGTPSEVELQVILDRLLVNKTVERVVSEPPKTLLISGERGPVTVVPIRTLTDEELLEVSHDKLFLNLEEMRVIQAYFRKLDRDPTDAELETIAQTWSEHCYHKTFKARLVVNGAEKPPLIARLKAGVERFGEDVLSAFADNSGATAFYEGLAVCGKVETHNSPSAIEPYGGAATGSGGVFRDILGTGQGAKVIVSTDIFCFAPPNLPDEKLPPGCLHPHYLLRRVVAGVRDYGNRMGIPTNNGSVHFHEDFRAKPTVIVGAYGLIPAAQSQKGKPQPGDCIIVIGGHTGRDGIHGATFSSGEMTERTISVNASAVQIGNAIEEKRMADAIIACRDTGLIRAITDCGAGGFSSAIGEMGSETGARVWLERAPLKYTGLAPWEIWLSESQERMVIAVAPGNVQHVLAICRKYNVEATVLGEFTDDRHLVVTYDGEFVCDLDMQFLHHGLPQRFLTARWQRPAFDEPAIPLSRNWADIYRRVLSHGNVCSKEPIVRLYDHSVQGTNALPPFSGLRHDGPNDAVVLAPVLGKPYGLIVSHGLNPVLNRIDPYWGSIWAAAEALANLVAVGGNPAEAWLIDNFIWPFPDEESLGALDRAVDGCVAAMEAFRRPFISGKDSLSSTYRGKDGTVIKIPPVLCISAFGRIPDVRKTVSVDFKEPYSYIVFVGVLDPLAMGGSVYYDIHGYVGNFLPKLDLAFLPNVFDAMHRLIQQGSVLACHDISEGGVAAALAEMCFGGGYGAEVDLRPLGAGRPDFLFFNEMAGSFLLEVRPDDILAIISAGVPAAILGRTIPEPMVSVTDGPDILFTVSVEELKRAWQQPMKEVFHG